MAPGGTGKTTLELFEAIHIVLGRPLYSLEVRKSGPVVVLTAEDSREICIARTRRIAEAMALKPSEIQKVCRNIRIIDVRGTGARLTDIIADTVKLAAFTDEVAEWVGDIEPVMVVVDPAVSFGCGESRVNDAEQGLIEAGRRLLRAGHCCVRFVHHSGKQNARDRTTDQYSGRGGSAFADGARMVHVLQPLDASAWCKATGIELEPGENGLILARPKMSYCPPQGDILLRRRGYLFEHIEPTVYNSAAKIIRHANIVWDVLSTEFQTGHQHSQNSLQALQTGLKRAEVRDAIHWLTAQNRIEYRDRPDAGPRGARQYLHPVGAPGAVGAAEPKTAVRCASEKLFPPVRRPIGKTSSAHRNAPTCTPVFVDAPNHDGAAAAQRAQREQDGWECEL